MSHYNKLESLSKYFINNNIYNLKSIIIDDNIFNNYMEFQTMK